MKPNTKTSNGNVTIPLNKPLAHPERQRRLDAMPPAQRDLREGLMRRRASQLNLGELQPGGEGRDIDQAVFTMLAEVKVLAAHALMMAHTLANLARDRGENAGGDAFWDSVVELPANIRATAEFTLECAEGVQSQLRDAGVLLEGTEEIRAV